MLLILAFFFHDMKLVTLSVLILGISLSMAAQSDLDRLIETERTFARTALEKGTRAAFLEFMANDAVVFVPDKTPARAFWTARPESNSALVWAPNYGEISSNGILGYTTGNWEYRAKGKADEPSAFGNFVTVWLRQPSGEYRWVVDLGVDHEKPEKYSDTFAGPTGPGGGNTDKISAADSANRFFETTAKFGIQKAYSTFADANVRFFRENEFPGFGRNALIGRAKKDKGAFTFAKRSVFFESDDLAYVTNTYTFAPDKGEPVNGNFLQVWKLIDGKWKIVLDLFKPLPRKAQ
jgi:ketosteroid isomerase-like protein